MIVTVVVVVVVAVPLNDSKIQFCLLSKRTNRICLVSLHVYNTIYIYLPVPNRRLDRWSRFRGLVVCLLSLWVVENEFATNSREQAHRESGSFGVGVWLHISSPTSTNLD